MQIMSNMDKLLKNNWVLRILIKLTFDANKIVDVKADQQTSCFTG